VSGEHGIGLTKIQYLDENQLTAFRDYKQRVDPEQVFNRGKLLAGSGLQNAYTPSLRLVELEAIILEYSALGGINDAIKSCLRCGKCKPECMTHIPEANLLYSPRDKILATGIIIEAFLYEEQTRRGLSIRHFDELNDIADHCTTCHKCLNSCPVNIDFGDVSISMRSILITQRKKPFNPGSQLALWFLNMSDPTLIKITRQVMIRTGLRMVRWLRSGLRRFGLMPVRSKRPPGSTGKPVFSQQLVNFVRHPVRAKVPAQSMRQLLSIEEASLVPVIRNPESDQSNRDSVFYFPGCGSERLFSEIGIAALGMLYETGTRTVLPPGYICCGYPQTSAGQAGKGQELTSRNRVLFHRVANTLNYLDIKTVVVSCGTCLDQLEQYRFDQIFPGSRIMDIHEYLLEKGSQANRESEYQYTWHDPCHTPIKRYEPTKLVRDIMRSPVELSERCCGEAGTLATARPDIAQQLYSRKLESLQNAKSRLSINGKPVKCLTACPACQQGLSRYQKETATTTEFIVVELARLNYGEDWQQQFLHKITNGGIEKVLL
ncbi:MAG: FAD-binding oxidoreductase, partial [Gammaproteobacteria bacterium]|nr:FAD-binding oxidoreductase [Gammaproteobacteria bacterium]